jgi:hypothetical protein
MGPRLFGRDNRRMWSKRTAGASRCPEAQESGAELYGHTGACYAGTGHTGANHIGACYAGTGHTGANHTGACCAGTGGNAQYDHEPIGRDPKTLIGVSREVYERT